MNHNLCIMKLENSTVFVAKVNLVLDDQKKMNDHQRLWRNGKRKLPKLD